MPRVRYRIQFTIDSCFSLETDVCINMLLHWLTEDNSALPRSAKTDDLANHPLACGVRQFVLFLVSETRACPEILRASLIYINRLRSRPGEERLLLSRDNFCRVFTVCLLIASKYLGDAKQRLKIWAALTGLTASHLAKVEAQVLIALRYRLRYDQNHPLRLLLLRNV